MEELPKDSAEPQTVRPDNDTETVNSCEFCGDVQLRAVWNDAHKARLLRRVARSQPGIIDQAAALALADRLEPKVQDSWPMPTPTCQSPASSRFVIGEQLRQVAEFGAVLDEWVQPSYRFKIYPCAWAIDFENLRHFDAPEMVKSLGATFGQIGLDDEHGALIAFLHGEYDPRRNLCRFSLSGIASRGPARLLAKLGRFPIFRDFPFGDESWNEDLGDPFIKRVSVTELHVPAHHEAGLFQFSWPQCPTILNADLKFERLKDHRELPESVEAQTLLWLNQFELADLTMMVGLVDGEFGIGCASSFNGL